MNSLVINRQSVSLEGNSADLMLLELVRESRQLCGTKEGCASGDCGACTVVIVPSEETIAQGKSSGDLASCRYRAINSCITFANSLDGHQIITADDPSADEMLISVREAMVNSHASQCGFCTPGFVMSTYALIQNAKLGLENPIDGDWTPIIERYLGGNLCRCTGYRPIIDACKNLLSRVDQLKATTPRPVLSDAKASSSSQSGSESSDTEVFLRPGSLIELDHAIDTYPNAKLLAGGTDLALEVTQNLESLQQIIWLGDVEEMQGVSFAGSQCTLGAGVSLYRLREALCEQFPDLSGLLLRFGSEQIRARGTIGGNLGTASPIGDLPPVLLALDATVVIGGRSELRQVPVSDFFLDYRQTSMKQHEYIVSILLPDIDDYRDKENGAFLKVYKVSKRLDDDISSVCAAFSGQIQDGKLSNVRAAFGGVAAIPLRFTEVENALNGKSLDGSEGVTNIEAAQHILKRELNPISDARASEWYRRLVTANLLYRLRLELLHTSHVTRVEHYD